MQFAPPAVVLVGWWLLAVCWRPGPAFLLQNFQKNEILLLLPTRESLFLIAKCVQEVGGLGPEEVIEEMRPHILPLSPVVF